MMYISIHIPKTAGTTIAAILDYGFDRHILYDYKEDYNVKVSPDYISRHMEFIMDHFKVIHGHFFYRKYAGLFEDAKYLTTIRHPVDRVISQFNHNLNLNPLNAVWPAKEIIEGNMDIVEFASIENIGNAQSQFLEGLPIEAYDFVFITEQLEKSLTLFQKLFDFRRNDPYIKEGLPKINSYKVRPKRHMPDDSIKKEIFKRTTQDNELYRMAVEIFKAKFAKYAD